MRRFSTFAAAKVGVYLVIYKQNARFFFLYISKAHIKPSIAFSLLKWAIVPPMKETPSNRKKTAFFALMPGRCPKRYATKVVSSSAKVQGAAPPLC